MIRNAQGPWADLALHTIGWKAFQDLCSQVCMEVLKRPVEIYRDAQDDGQDAVFLSKSSVTEDPSPATIQCKFSSKSTQRLTPSSLRLEEQNIIDLVATGDAQTYILITSMGVDAGVVRQLKHRLRELGVKKPHVLGREFLTLAIRTNARLRALVPQVYGIGDLSVILDERRAQQTKELLGQWLPMLQYYVPTAPHRAAVHALAEHRIVLLLGNPATGKSTLAAILSVLACDRGNITCFQVTGPRDFDNLWNPNESNRFYWIDDAFGSNQPRDEYIQDWADIFRKVQAAIAKGNRFVLTSRRHIYGAASILLGSRNLPVFMSGQAVVNVGALSLEEKRQILYNHIKGGGQSREWKRRVKDHLSATAEAQHFVPGMARRLGDPMFTKRLPLTTTALREFVSEPRDHLIHTIEELSDAHQAALALIFVHQGRMSVTQPDEQAFELISSAFSVDKARLTRAIRELKGSFVEEINDGRSKVWVFDHPTILDAATELFRRDAAMTQIFISGAKFESIASSVVCEGVAPIEDAMTVPISFNKVLVERIAAAPDDRHSNDLLFAFLAKRASDVVFSEIMSACPDIFYRETKWIWSLKHDPKIIVRARARKLGILNEDDRTSATETLEGAIFGRNDISFVDDDDILGLFEPRQLMQLTLRMRKELLAELSDQIEAIRGEPDFDKDPPDNFQELESYLEELGSFFSDDDEATASIDGTHSEIHAATKDIAERKEELERERDRAAQMEEDDRWTGRMSYRPTQRSTDILAEIEAKGQAPRSMFSDVDE